MRFQRNKNPFDLVEKNSNINQDDELNIPNLVQKRETHITNLVESIVLHSKRRLFAKIFFQYLITFIFLGLVVGLSFLLFNLINKICEGKIDNLPIVVTILSTNVASLIASIFTVIFIITKYIFPSEEEKKSNEILTIILNSDLKYLNFIKENDEFVKKDIKSKDGTEK